MSQVSVPPSRKGLLIKLAVLAVVALVGVVLVLRGVDIKGLYLRSLELVRGVGPVAFFAGLAILPAVGFPVMAFTLSAGPVFVPQLGLAPVLALVVLSLAVNLVLTYWLGRYALRPALEWLIVRLGYKLPQVAAEDHVTLTVLVRVTPGPPFFVQNYLLGLARVPFKTYFGISLAVSSAYSLATVIFGDSVAQGKVGMVLFALSMIVALAVGVKWLRRRYTRKKANAVETASSSS